MSTVRRARINILQEAMGDPVIEYAMLQDYVDEINRSNPGSTCFVDVNHNNDGTRTFVRFYMCLHALKEGFKEGCRKVIGLDGCFLKGPCQGQLLVAVSKDANNQMFPIAWAIVDLENTRSWSWFINVLKNYLDLGLGDGLVLVSDMQKGLIAVVDQELPECQRRWCARHIWAAWQKKWKGDDRRKKFWQCAYSTFEGQLTDHLKELDTMGENIVQDMLSYSKELWIRVFFDTDTKCDIVENNMCETFNGWILQARHLTVITMLEEIRVKIMNRIRVMREFAETWITDISPMAQKKLDENKLRACDCMIEFNGDQGFEVLDMGFGHTIDLAQHTCSCRSWQLKGIPCAHACCAMARLKKNPDHYVSHWYSKETYLKSYAKFIQPVRGRKLWPQLNYPTILPPVIAKKPGRPKKNRRKDKDEPQKPTFGKLSKKGVGMTCTLCKGQGHNKKSCNLRSRGSAQASVNVAPPSGAVSSTAPPRTTAPELTRQVNCTAPPRIVIPAPSRIVTPAPPPVDQILGVLLLLRQKIQVVHQVVQLGEERYAAPTQASNAKKRLVGFGLHHLDNGLTISNIGTPSARIVNPKQIRRSADVTGDIDFKPPGLRWSGRNAVSSNKLQQDRDAIRMNRLRAIQQASQVLQANFFTISIRLVSKLLLDSTIRLLCKLLLNFLFVNSTLIEISDTI
ncbi:uncharacterized protein LOC126687706 [Mercurialis annua]|uniref:uncharacterized protein LOC126687706 n=1 Tax=Mercurialis annua TaxID=3986 RepID=UPI002160625E|nr:uncharacterized protein LOC126687706 [Mercurialis annua]